MINDIKAASLRHLVEIDAPVDTQDSNGDPVRTWEVYAEIHAEIEHLRANEMLALQTIHGAVDTRFRLRCDVVTKQITEKYRIRYDGTIYNLYPPLNVRHRGTKIEILAKSGLNDG
jgi:SPP1 family predicted phage head-tail adaptor